MSDSNLFHGPNAGYLLDLYDQYRENPDSVDEQTRELFARWNPEIQLQDSPPAATVPTGAASEATLTPALINRIVAAARVTRLVRELGHMAARIDPLGSEPPGDAGLELATHGLTAQDLKELPASVVSGPLAEGAANALEALGRLRQAYSGPIGYETDHIQVDDERKWLWEAIETRRFFKDITVEEKRDLLERLTEVETFEKYLDKTFLKAKRFSIEGTDMLVPILDEIIHKAAASGTREVMLGMAHRGRLNVMVHVLGKPYGQILAEFMDAHASEQEETGSVAGRATYGWTGDVKYHLGASRAYKESGIEAMPITLVPNPSHLEFVNPVVQGHARAAQDSRTRPGEPVQDIQASLPIAIHGDAAFPGQGVVAETLNLWNLRGYRTGGTIHIITNNQVGFTTLPQDGRSTLYAGDLAKGFEVPIVHVNADDPEACIAAARMAFAYRQTFHKDFLIDLIGYRRYGHNEGEEPEVTQPRMYETIASHPRIRERWATTLEKAGVVTHDETEAMILRVEERLNAAKNAPIHANVPDDSENIRRGSRARTINSAVPIQKLKDLNEQLLSRKPGFAASSKLENILARRRAALTQSGGIAWGHAESLAYASILSEGTPIRLTGQDTERGTFAQRHLVLHNPTDGETYCPMQNLPSSRAAFALFNSPLSETAALGFEYGYSIHAPGVLVLWEAQFGDFINGAQVIIDQFLVSGAAKWRQIPSLVLLLPHGYEGQGPEHSSARIERFLQLAANDNIRVVNCTTAAQYFHLLRRQSALLELEPRPLIVMTPKSLLRNVNAGSSLSDLAEGRFQPIINDADAVLHAGTITRLVLCSGKVYVDLKYAKPNTTDVREEFAAASGSVAVARIEELYPFPADELREIIAGYPNLQEIVWLQEEPCNQGAWTYIAPRIRELADWSGELTYVGRPESASPAEGSIRRHKIEQARILATALASPPALPSKVRRVAQAR